MHSLSGLFIFLLVVLIVCLNYVMVIFDPRALNHNDQPNYSTPNYRIQAYKHDRPKTTRCSNLLHNLAQGDWLPRDDLQYKEIRRQQDTDMQLRKRKGWPTFLFHGDLRCGTKYPLPRVVQSNHTESYYMDIASQCDPNSIAPCCRDDVGWCGRGNWFCNCDTCNDFRKIMVAEFALWQPHGKCTINNYTSLQACDFVSKHYNHIIFIGDSLVRHLFSSLLILLTDDTQSGALQRNLSEYDFESCKGESQFADSFCHKKLAMHWSDIRKNNNYCTNRKKKSKPTLSFVEAYNAEKVEEAIEAIGRLTKRQQKTLILVGVGVHDNFDHAKIIDKYFTRILEKRQSHGLEKSTVIWLNTHAAGPLKPLGFQQLQGNKRIKAFNTELDRFCKDNNIPVFDTYNLTVGVHSFDGTHYGYAVNKVKTQILLNGLEEMEKVKRSAVTGIS